MKSGTTPAVDGYQQDEVQTNPGPEDLFTRHGLPFDAEAIEAIAGRHHLTRLLVYGSLLRDDFGPESDVDMLVEFEPGHTPGWEFVDIQDGLSAAVGRQVDLGTPAGLSRYIRDRVLSEARTLYVRR